MPTIPELLDESEKNIKKLVSEIESIKSFRELNQTTVESLESVCDTLEKVSVRIEPFKTVRIYLLLSVLSIASILNIIFLVVNFIFLLKHF